MKGGNGTCGCSLVSVIQRTVPRLATFGEQNLRAGGKARESLPDTLVRRAPRAGNFTASTLSVPVDRAGMEANMSKPTIFLSHSSADEKVLRKLKDLILEKTGNTIEIFLSSDGQSIPLGRNWVHKIEEELEHTKAMLVFLSPASTKSQWVYFEAGYAYSKDVRVVPIGILGVDLTRIGPPLGLLQGFNITSADGLNNIIAVINDVFDYAHAESFTDEEYDQLFMPDEARGRQILGYATSLINQINIVLPLKEEAVLSTNERTIADLLDKLGTQYHMREGNVEAFGMSLWVRGNEIRARLDPSLAGMNFETIDRILSSSFVDASRPVHLDIAFLEGVRSIDTSYKRSAKLFGTPISYVNSDTTKTKRELSFGELYFDISTLSFREARGTATFYADYFGMTLSQMKLNELFTVLFESGILYVAEGFD
jgi:hypothetical protein